MIQKDNNTIKHGQILSSKELVDIFLVSNQGGMRRSLKTNSLVLIANHIKDRRSQYTETVKGRNIYEDQWIDDIFWYTGMGLEGDQSLDFMQNKTLYESNNNNVDIYLFEVFNKGEFQFSGKVKLSSDPIFVHQDDVKGNRRKVYLFPLKVIEIECEIINTEDKLDIESYDSTQFKKDITFEDQEKKAFEELEQKKLTEEELLKAIEDNVNNISNNHRDDDKFENNLLSSYQILNLNKDISDFHLSVRARNILNREKMKKLGDIIKKNENDFRRLPNLGYKTHQEIKNLLKKNNLSFGMKFDNSLIDNNNDINDINDIDNSTLAALNFKFNFADLSKRTKNCFLTNNISKYGHIAQLSDVELRNFPNLGNKSISEIELILKKENLSFHMNIKNIDWEIAAENNENVKDIIREREKNNRITLKNIDLENLLNEREKLIFTLRLEGKTLEEIGQKHNITRERIRQIESSIYNKIISNLGNEYLYDGIINFCKIFDDLRSPVMITDLIKHIESFQGLGRITNPYEFVNKITHQFSKKNNVPPIIYEKIGKNLPNFYPNSSKYISFETLFKNLEKKFKDIIIKDKNNLKDNNDIRYEIYKSNRRDVYDLVIAEIQNFPLNLFERFIAFFYQQKDLISMNKAQELSGLPRFSRGVEDLNDNGIYEFGRGKWGTLEKFYHLNSSEEDLITDYIIEEMNLNSRRAYNTEELFTFIYPKLESITEKENIDKIDSYHIDIALNRASKRGKKIFDQKRGYWALENRPREFSKDIIREILFQKNRLMHADEIINEMSKTKNITTKLIQEDPHIKRFGRNIWGLITWEEEKDSAMIQEEIDKIEEGIKKTKKYLKNKKPKNKKPKNKKLKYREENFDIYISLLKRYIDLYGNADMQSRSRFEGKNLYHWIWRQKKDYHLNKLNDREVQDLESIDGWSWDIKVRAKGRKNKKDFSQWLDLVKKFAEINGHINIKVKDKFEDYNLGTWVYKIQRDYYFGKLSDQEIQQLNAINGWNWGEKPKIRNRPKVSEVIDILKRYRAINNHLNVSFDEKLDGVNIGRWVHRKKSSYESGKIDASTQKALEDLDGWSWEKRKTNNKYDINDTINFIKRYKEINGHVMIPVSTKEDGKKYGALLYRYKQDYKKGKLEESIIDSLNKVEGWSWEHQSIKKTDQDKVIAAIKSFQKREGHLKVKRDHIEDGINLYNYINAKKHRYKKGVLGDKTIKKLESIEGWIW